MVKDVLQRLFISASTANPILVFDMVLLGFSEKRSGYNLKPVAVQLQFELGPEINVVMLDTSKIGE